MNWRKLEFSLDPMAVAIRKAARETGSSGAIGYARFMLRTGHTPQHVLDELRRKKHPLSVDIEIVGGAPGAHRIGGQAQRRGCADESK